MPVVMDGSGRVGKDSEAVFQGWWEEKKAYLPRARGWAVVVYVQVICFLC